MRNFCEEEQNNESMNLFRVPSRRVLKCLVNN